MGIPALIEAMRPQQWVKNGFVVAPLLFAGKVGVLSAVRDSGVAFVAFAFGSSAIYLLNDVLDREQDRRHPEKSRRPIASGRLSISAALITAVVLAASSLFLSWFLGLTVLVCTGLYIGLQIGYCLFFKHWVIIDVMVLGVGFVLRVLAGAGAVEAEASQWLILCTLLLALFLGFAKRRHELVALGEGSGKHRRVLEEYSAELVDQISSVLLGATIVCYAIYTISPRTHDEVSENLVYSVVFVIYGLFRYLYLVQKGRYAGSPTEALLKDIPLFVCVLLWAVYCWTVIYF